MTIFNRTRIAAGTALAAAAVAVAGPAVAMASEPTAVMNAAYAPLFSDNINDFAAKIEQAGLLDGKTQEEKDNTLASIFGTVAGGISFADGKISEDYTPTFQLGTAAEPEDIAKYAEAMRAQGIFDGQSEAEINSTLAGIYGENFTAVEVPDSNVDPEAPAEEIPAPNPDPVPEPGTSGSDDPVLEDMPQADETAGASPEAVDGTEGAYYDESTGTYDGGGSTDSYAEPQLANTGASLGLLTLMGLGTAGAGAMLVRRKDA